jgi:hypothetical protein
MSNRLPVLAARINEEHSAVASASSAASNRRWPPETLLLEAEASCPMESGSMLHVEPSRPVRDVAMGLRLERAVEIADTADKLKLAAIWADISGAAARQIKHQSRQAMHVLEAFSGTGA